MRRSAAPSQSCSLKRPRFCSPALKKTTSDSCSELNDQSSSSINSSGHQKSANKIIDVTRNKTSIDGCNISLGKEYETHCVYKTTDTVNNSELSVPDCCQELVRPALSADDIVLPFATIQDGESTNCDTKHVEKKSSLISCSCSNEVHEVICNCNQLADGSSTCARTLLDKMANKQEKSLSSNEDKAFKKANYQSAVVEMLEDSVDVPDGIPARPKFCTPKMKGLSFRSPLAKLSNQHSVSNTSKEESVKSMSEISCYFSVMWCKLSKKKHKKWEGDAVLRTFGRSATLQDMDGKIIGKSTGFKNAELSSMDVGHTLVIGGKEIEVMCKLSEADYKSGKCFHQSSVQSVPSVTFNSGVSKPFQQHQLSRSKYVDDTKRTQVISPKFDPLHPDALVMPRPSLSHQQQHNRRKEQVIDVVIDPHLVVHLRPHQRDGVTFMYECTMGMKDYNGSGVILADDMGLGKTLQCITLIWTLLKQGPYGMRPEIKRVLIVTPSSLVKNWCCEFRKWLGSERLSVFSASSDNRVDEFVKSPLYPVLVISYEMLMMCYDDICKLKFDLVVCDEGHRLKNSTIKTATMIAQLPTRRRVVLTGTPIQNDLQEFYSLVDFCNPGILGSKAAFRKVFEEPIVSSKHPGVSEEVKELGRDRAAELSRLTGLFILRRTQEINSKYLPPKVEMVVFCPPSQLQLRLYHKLLGSRMVRSCFNLSVDGTPHLVCIGALKKLCNHPHLLFEKARGVEILKEEMFQNEDDSLYHGLLSLYPGDYDPVKVMSEHSGKMAVVSCLLSAINLAETREKIVLVSNYTQTLDLLQRLCEDEGYSYVRLDGQTPANKRQQMVENFNSRHSQDFVFLLSSKAGGTGLNLIGASRLVLFDIDWNPANDLQAMARVWRDGQRKKVHIYRLLTTGTIEEKIYQRQINKQGLSGAVVDMKTGSDMNFSRDDLKDIFHLREDIACDTHDLLGCRCQDVDQIKPSIKSSPKNNLSMNELKDWLHVQVENEDSFVQDKYLSQASSYISFIFWHESYQQPVHK